jgi:hypothetical protein
MKLIHKPIDDALDERVVVTVSPANLLVRPDGSIVTKNNARIRLYFDPFLLQSYGYEDGTRLKFIGMSPATMAVYLQLGDEGNVLSPISGSGKSEIAVPASMVKGIGTLPRLRKAKCWFGLCRERHILAIKLPIGAEGV